MVSVPSDGETRETDSGQARIAYNGVERVCPVLFGEEDIYLLGATTLEILKLMVDPMNQELVSAHKRTSAFVIRPCDSIRWGRFRRGQLVSASDAESRAKVDRNTPVGMP